MNETRTVTWTVETREVLSGRKQPPTLEQVANESHELAQRIEATLDAVETTNATNAYGVQVTRALLHSFIESLTDLALNVERAR